MMTGLIDKLRKWTWLRSLANRIFGALDKYLDGKTLSQEDLARVHDYLDDLRGLLNNADLSDDLLNDIQDNG